MVKICKKIDNCIFKEIHDYLPQYYTCVYHLITKQIFKAPDKALFFTK